MRSPVKKKILLLLAGGVALGLARNPRTQKYILKTIHRDLKEIDRKYLAKIVKEFKEERLVEWTAPVLLHCYTNIQKVKACGSMR